jgi:hypothetical protein
MVVENVGDPPVRRRLDIDDEIDAAAICAIEHTTTEDHLAPSVGGTDLARRELERREDRIESVGNRGRSG